VYPTLCPPWSRHTVSKKGGERDTMCTGTHPYIPVPNTVEARLNYATGGGVAQNVLNFTFDHAPTIGDLTQLGVDLSAWFGADMAPLMNSGVSLQSIVLTDLTVENGAQIEYTTGMPIGGSGGSSMPDNVTLAVKHTTAFRGRSYRGRTYLVGPPREMLQDIDHFSTPYTSNVENAFDDLLVGDFLANGSAFSVVSRCQNGAWLATGVSTPVENNTVEPTVDSQRRRLPGRGI